jgi:DNA-binding NarL/FixJ family response regulator
MDVIRVLLVDDHAILRAGVRALIESQDDMEVVGESADASEGIAAVAALAPDVVVLDISMPGTSGLKVIKDLLAASPGSRILMLTMHDDVAYVRLALSSGAAGYLVKTQADTELLAAIRTVHRGRSYIDVSLDSETLKQMLDAAGGQSVAEQSEDLLSRRERQVLEHVAYGHTHKEIAAKFDISVKSVETYRARIASKLGLKSRADLVRFALERGILSRDRA